MLLFKYLKRQLKRLKIDLLTQRTFLAGGVPSIDNNNIIKTVSTNYEELEIIFFEHSPLRPGDVLIDVGCGKGRVFSYLLYKGLKNKMIGYEINESVGLNTARRLKQHKNIEIRVDNIFDDFPPDGNVFYLYNPFKDKMMESFRAEILNISHRNPVIIYNNPVHLSLFDTADFTYQYYDLPVPEYNYKFQFAVIKTKQG
ncbi:class I SAM-dependent methyltransferase [Mucilaginibacter phyllosphaerae]|uniref:SAM-dependent methyltransferase n=1 Tax=Mucilaginibacter phyllosphaerae TaxID=1812349 RepID=A0A4Y8AE16_9SPHI|nr:class I SAM-dependent methyltransferase [Mucilaginibacter phyllosphaerae]MBB3970049.1 SAM-dependent methyltransferase [Mucilaginibacter phyllosphaerae]TEW66442.1 hypothetical protein E2R65_08410 [Mucilaginibacter phyllosphaerae]GGH09437.1 hypothetical protein GCM10007352_14820 [Mucilaginibacter phyllosphaerae]